MTSLFPLVLADLRNRRRLSQVRLAEVAGFDHSYVSRLESGTRVPTRRSAEALATALRCSADERAMLLEAAGFLPVAGVPYVEEVRRLSALLEVLDPTVAARLRAVLAALVDLYEPLHPVEKTTS